MDLDALLAQQDGLATRGQLSASDVSPAALQWRLTRGWRLVLPGVVCCRPGPLSPHQRLVAALLYAGPNAAIGSLSAAAWHGVLAAGADPRVHLLVPASRQLSARNPHLVVARTTRPDHGPWQRGPLRVTSRARSVADATRAAGNLSTARGIVIEAVQRQIVRPADLRHDLEAGPRPGSGWLRRALHEAQEGTWSLPESDLLRLAATSRVLPEAWANPALRSGDGTRLPMPDLWFDDVGLAVQVHSHRYHASGPDWDATVMNDGVFAEYGVALVAVTPGRIARDQTGVLAGLERAYQAAGRGPGPDVTARRQDPW